MTDIGKLFTQIEGSGKGNIVTLLEKNEYEVKLKSRTGLKYRTSWLNFEKYYELVKRNPKGKEKK